MGKIALKCIGRALCCIALACSFPALANDLVVEGSIDETPAEIKKLAGRAAALEGRIREIEQRIAESQKQLLGQLNENSVEYKLDLKLAGASDATPAKENVAVSHVRLSIDGRPFSYTQSALIVTPSSPLPLFLGRISAGKYLMRVQLQAAPIDERISNSATAAWQTLEKTLPIEVAAEAGTRQVQRVEIENGPDGLKLRFGKDLVPETPREFKITPEKL
ncbi:MAG: hypothetical protein RI932_1190 [Pseudomonadota bacterium]